MVKLQEKKIKPVKFCLKYAFLYSKCNYKNAHSLKQITVGIC